MRPGGVLLAKAGWVYTAFWLALRAVGRGGFAVPVWGTLLYAGITFWLFDRVFYTRPGTTGQANTAASAAEGVVAALLVWFLGRYLPGAPLGWVIPLLAGVGVGLGEWFVHQALRGPEPVSERRNRPPGFNDE